MPSPSRLTEYSTRDAMSKHALTALGSDTMTTSRTSISPLAPKALRDRAAASGEPASADVGTAYTNAMLMRR